MDIMISGAMVGGFAGFIISLFFTKGPKYPGDTTPSGGLGCGGVLAFIVVGAILGAIWTSMGYPIDVLGF